MCSEPVARIEYDILDNVVRCMQSSPDDAYWARRLIDLVRDPVTATRLRPHIVTAIGRWASHDPSFFVHEKYLSEQLAVWAWSREILEDLDRALRLEDASLTHLIMGRLWLAARRPPEDMPEFYARAALHLREVGEHLRFGAWHEAMCEALSVADPDELARSASEILNGAPPSARDRALLAILRGAARTGNWSLYDQHRAQYGLFDEDPATRMNSELSRLDGLRAEYELVHGTSFRDPRPSAMPTKPSETMSVRERAALASRPSLKSAMPSLVQLFERTGRSKAQHLAASLDETLRPKSRPRG